MQCVIINLFSVVANQCTRWAFERLVQGQASVVFTDNNATATVTCNSGYSFHSQNDDTTQLNELVYTCTGSATEYTNAMFQNYVPQCVGMYKLFLSIHLHAASFLLECKQVFHVK